MKDISTFKLSNAAIIFILVAFVLLVSIPIVGLNKINAEDSTSKAQYNQDKLLKLPEESDLKNLRHMSDSNDQEIKELISRVNYIENYLRQNSNINNQNMVNRENAYSCEVTGYADLNNNPIIPPEIGNDVDFSGDVARGRKKIILTCGIAR